MRRQGLTLTELVVAITIIAILLAIILPAVQYARESARRGNCLSNLRQIAIATQAYEAQHRVFPAGANNPGGASPLAIILPFLERQDLYARVKFETVAAWESPAAQEAVPLFLCPSDDAPRIQNSNGGRADGGGTNYAGNSGTWQVSHGFNGVFRPWRTGRDGGPPISPAEIRDGLSQTCLFAEILMADGSPHRRRVLWNLDRSFWGAAEIDAFANYCGKLPQYPAEYGWRGDLHHRGRPWTHGNLAVTLFNHVSPPNQPSCLNQTDVSSAAATAASFHPGGVHVAFADAHVEFVSDHIDRQVWRSQGSIHGDTPLPNP